MASSLGIAIYFSVLSASNALRLESVNPGPTEMHQQKTASVPIFITSLDKLKVFKQSVQSLEAIKSAHHIVILDTGTTFQPTLRYLDTLKKRGVEVIQTNGTHNVHFKRLIAPIIENYMAIHPEYEYFVLTDSDVELDNVNPDILEVYAHLLGKLGTDKVGCTLRIDDIPDYYPYKREGAPGMKGKGVLEWERQFWHTHKKVARNDGGEPLTVYTAAIDSTFALYHRSTKLPGDRLSSLSAVRVGAPYGCRHLDWYIDPANCSPDQIYYAEHSDSAQHNSKGGTHWTPRCSNSKTTPEALREDPVSLINKISFFGQMDEASLSHMTRPRFTAYFERLDHGRLSTAMGTSIIVLLLSGLIVGVVNLGAVLLILKIASFFLCGSSLIFLNQAIMTKLNFPFPFTISGLGLLTTAAITRFSVDILGIGSVRSDTLHAVSGMNWFCKVLPIAGSKAMTMAFGNCAYIYLGLGYIQMLKTFNPVIILAMMMACGMQMPSAQAILGVCIMVAGTTMQVQAGGPLTLIGLIAMLASETSEAVSTVLTQKLFQNEKFSVLESLYVLALPGGVLLYLIAAVVEWPSIYQNGNFEAFFHYPLHFAVAALLGLAVNFTSMMVLEATSSLTLKLLVTARSVVLICLAGYVYHEIFTPTEICSYTLSLAGFLGYTWVQTKQSRTSKEQDS